MELSTIERLTLASILPQERGSLEEAVRVRRLRDRISLTEEEQEEVGDVSSFEGVLDPLDIEFSDEDRKIIAYGFLDREENENVPTGSVFLDLYEEFSDTVKQVKHDLA